MFWGWFPFRATRESYFKRTPSHGGKHRSGPCWLILKRATTPSLFWGRKTKTGIPRKPMICPICLGCPTLVLCRAVQVEVKAARPRVTLGQERPLSDARHQDFCMSSSRRFRLQDRTFEELQYTGSGSGLRAPRALEKECPAYRFSHFRCPMRNQPKGTTLDAWQHLFALSTCWCSA